MCWSFGRTNGRDQREKEWVERSEGKGMGGEYNGYDRRHRDVCLQNANPIIQTAGWGILFDRESR